MTLPQPSAFIFDHERRVVENTPSLLMSERIPLPRSPLCRRPWDCGSLWLCAPQLQSYKLGKRDQTLQAKQLNVHKYPYMDAHLSTTIEVIHNERRQVEASQAKT